VPDATTVWLFCERLVKAKAIDKLFARFDVMLKDRGYLAMGGQIIDASVVPAPKQRNTKEEKAAIGTVGISVCGRAVEHYAAMALMKRSPKMTANWALAMDHSRGGIFHSFSERFKIR